MNSLRLRFAGLTGVDKNAINSILKQSAGSLTQDWIVIEDGHADLVIYCFETDSGQQAWQNRGKGITALLSSGVNIAEPVDIIISKPLYKDTLIAVFNLVAEKIHQSEMVEPQRIASLQHRNLFKRLFHIKPPQPAALRALRQILSAAPEPVQSDAVLIKDAQQLNARLHQLSHHQDTCFSSVFLDQLKTHDLHKLKLKQQLQILEIYYEFVVNMLFTHDLVVMNRPLYFSAESLLSIQSLDTILATLSRHYQQVTSLYIDQQTSFTADSPLLFSLNRASECLCLQILHNFRYYRAIPAGVWQQLHQIYLFHESAGTLQLQPELNKESATAARRFFDLYVQIIIVALADPYRLEKFDVFQLYTIVEKLTDTVCIRQLTKHDIQLNKHIQLTGHFCIDLESDGTPTNLFQTDDDCKTKTSARLLDLHALLDAIESMLKSAKLHNHASPDTALQLLKKSIPLLNGQLDRSEPKLNNDSASTIQITHGISAVNQSLTGDVIHTLNWQRLNASQDNCIRCYRPSKDCYPLNIGDFIAVTGIQESVQLASINWLHISPSQQTIIGLELIGGRPVPIICIPEGEAEQHKALLLLDDVGKESSIITEKGLYSPNRIMQIKQTGEPKMINITSLINSTVDYEHFNYKRHNGS